LKHSSENCF